MALPRVAWESPSMAAAFLEEALQEQWEVELPILLGSLGPEDFVHILLDKASPDSRNGK